jgi:WD40 repeat protein
VTFSPDHRRLLSADAAGGLCVRERESGQVVFRLPPQENGVSCVAVSPRASHFALAGTDRRIRVWDVVRGRELKSFQGHTGDVTGLSFSPEGRRLASGSADQTVKLWDVVNGEEALTLKGHTLDVWSVAFNPRGDRLASTSADGTVILWDATPWP